MTTPATPTIRVLILDDDAAVRESLGSYLSDVGFDVSTAGTVEEGLAHIASSRTDIAVVDLRLSGSSGEAFILRARTQQPGLRIVIYTASNAYMLPPSLRQIGLSPADVLHKPVQDLAEVARALRTAAPFGASRS